MIRPRIKFPTDFEQIGGQGPWVDAGQHIGQLSWLAVRQGAEGRPKAQVPDAYVQDLHFLIGGDGVGL